MKNMMEFPEDSPVCLLAIMLMDYLGSEPIALKRKLRSHLISIRSREEPRDSLEARLEMFGDMLSDAILEASLYSLTGSVDTSIFDEISKEIDEMERDNPL